MRELLQRAPEASFVYLGDTARTPYGNKSPETVIRYALEDAEFLISKGATSIVIACNSASAVASEELKKKYPNIPVFEVITPAAQDALVVTKGRIGVIGTRATINSKAYEHNLKPETRNPKPEIFARSCPLFVPLVEEGWLERSETKRIVRYYLSSLKQQNIDTLILGCTHYPLLRPLVQRFIGNKVKIIDSASSVVSRILQTEGLIKSGDQLYYLTDVSKHSEEVAQKWLGHSIVFKQALLS